MARLPTAIGYKRPLGVVISDNGTQLQAGWFNPDQSQDTYYILSEDACPRGSLTAAYTQNVLADYPEPALIA